MDYNFFLRHTWLALISPSKVLDTIRTGTNSARHLRNNLLFPLLFLVALFSFLGSLIFPDVTFHPLYSVVASVKLFLLDLFLVYVSSLIFREIAKALDLEADFSLSFMIIVYTLTPLFLCQMVSFLFQSLVFVNILSLYGLWILWTAGETLLGTPEHKKMPLVVASFVVIAELYIGGFIAFSSVFDRIFYAFFA